MPLLTNSARSITPPEAAGRDSPFHIPRNPHPPRLHVKPPPNDFVEQPAIHSKHRPLHPSPGGDNHFRIGSAFPKYLWLGRPRTPSVPGRAGSPPAREVLRRNLKSFQILGRQVNPTVGKILSDIAQDVVI